MAQDGTLGKGQSAYYKVVVAAGQTLQVAFDSQTATSINELFVSFGTLPTIGQFDYRAATLTADPALTIPTTQAGTYYILAYGSSVPSSPENYSLTASEVPFAVQSAGPTSVGTGPVTIQINGSKFDNNTTFQLLGPGGIVVDDDQIQLQDSSTAFARFDLTGKPTGSYTVQATQAGGATTTLAQPLTVVPAVPANLQIHLVVPQSTFPTSQGDVTVTYVNEGNTDVLAPLLELTADNAQLKLPDQSSFGGNSVWFLGTSTNGPAGVIRPGQTGQVTIQYSTVAGQGTSIQFHLNQADDTQPMDWASEEAGLQLPTIPNAAWPAVFANFVNNVGSSVASYHAALAADASYLSQFGEGTDDVLQLVSFELEKANAGYVVGTLNTVTADSLPAPGGHGLVLPAIVPGFHRRPQHRAGILGYGWTTNWDIFAKTTDAAGDAIVLRTTASPTTTSSKPTGATWIRTRRPYRRDLRQRRLPSRRA